MGILLLMSGISYRDHCGCRDDEPSERVLGDFRSNPIEQNQGALGTSNLPARSCERCARASSRIGAGRSGFRVAQKPRLSYEQPLVLPQVPQT
jgi:hypothetical protein